MHLTIFLVKSVGFGGSRFWVWGRREDGTVLYLIVGSLYHLFYMEENRTSDIKTPQ